MVYLIFLLCLFQSFPDFLKTPSIQATFEKSKERDVLKRKKQPSNSNKQL